jgi:outer membrane receptor protein involved in Fe transport
VEKHLNIATRCISCILAIVFMAPVLSADQPPQGTTSALEELLQTPISTAAKYDQRMSDVAASVTVISAEEIARYGWRTLAEVLASIRGVHTTYDRDYTYLGVRGIGLSTDYNSRFLVLVDGVKLTESVQGSVGIDTTLAIDLSSVARIEFVRGPGSVMYGTGAMFGVINLITKDEREPSSTTVGGGSGGLLSGAARVAFHGGDLSAAIAVWGQERKGNGLYYPEFDTPETNHGVVRNGDGNRHRSVLATAAWRGIEFLALQSTRTKEIPTASWETAFGSDQAATEGRTLFAVDITRTLGVGKTIVARAYNDRFDYHGEFPYQGGEFNNHVSASRTGGELRYVWDIVPAQRLTAGAEYSDDRISKYEFSDGPDAHSLGAPFRTSSLYAQVESRLSANMTLTAGASYDKPTNAPGQLTPRGALIVKPSPTSTLKLLYGQAFRSPNIFELEFAFGYVLKNENLQPEETRTFELVWEQALTSSVLVTASVFDQEVTDLIRLEPLPTGELQQQNRGEVHSRGFELQVDSRRNDGIWSYASFTWQRARELGQRMINSPLYAVKAGVSTPTSHRVYAGLEMQYEGSRLTYAGRETESALLTNLNVGGSIVGPFGASVAVRNLFDVRYGTPGGAEHVQDILEQDGRSFVVLLKWEGR